MFSWWQAVMGLDISFMVRASAKADLVLLSALSHQGIHCSLRLIYSTIASASVSGVSVHMLHIRIRKDVQRMSTVVFMRNMHYVCVQLYAYITHGNVHVLRWRTTVCICNIWTVYVKLSYMFEPYIYVIPVHCTKKRSLKKNVFH